jgi:hypothetical protein
MFDSLKKKTYGATSYGKNGEPASFGEIKPLTKAQRKSASKLIEVTEGPNTRAKKAARALWG